MSEVLLDTKKSRLVETKFNENELLEKCIEEVQNKLLKHPEITVYGKTVHQRRSIGFFSDTSIGYYYSGKLCKSQKLTESLTNLIEHTNNIFKSNFNGILVNYYETGEEYISAHTDDENGLDRSIGVVALSYGQPRTFRIRDKKTKKIIIDIPTKSYHYISMEGDFQKEFTHEIPIQKKIKNPRYSFTFRHHNK
jgi:alkylated DNA repair dioxygenase AlkB